MEADHLRENPPTPQQQETLPAITLGCKRRMRLLLAANNQAIRRNEIIKSCLQLGSSSNRYAPRLLQQETKSSTKLLAPTDPIPGPENLLKTGFAQRGLRSILMLTVSQKGGCQLRWSSWSQTILWGNL